MGVPLNVIDYRCFWKAVSAMRKFVFLILPEDIHRKLQIYLRGKLTV